MTARRRAEGGLSSLLLLATLACAPVPGPEPAGRAPGETAGGIGAAAEPAVSRPAARRSGGPRRRVASRFGASKADRGDLRLVYGDLESADYQELQDIFKNERFFEDVIDGLNASLVLPRNVEVRLEECGGINAVYDPETGAVSLCYELLEHFLQIFGEQLEAETDEEWEEVGGKAIAALVFVFYHELGHALVDVYDLPVTGREEDAVDQLATVMLLETWEGEDSELAILSSAEWFDLDAEGAEEDPDMADEHALDEQRYYNLVCWIYGSDPDYFADVVEEWELPAARAERCAGEYARMSQAWDTLLGPHMRSTS